MPSVMPKAGPSADHDSRNHRNQPGAPMVSPAIPRLSASLIVVNEKNEILLIKRNITSTSFAGMHVSVFPEAIEGRRLRDNWTTFRRIDCVRTSTVRYFRAETTTESKIRP